MATDEEIVSNFLGQESSETQQCEEECRNRNKNVRCRTENILPLSQTDPRNRIPYRYSVTKASTMVKEDCPQHHIHSKFILIRVNSGNDVGKEEKYVYQYRKQGRSVSNSGSYGRLFLLMDQEDEIGTL